MHRTSLLVPILAVGCASAPPEPEGPPELRVIAESLTRWTGVATTADGRVFVNYPRWSDNVSISVAELKSGLPVPYPKGRWNSWSQSADPTERFVCVQSVVVDDAGFLWALDAANPRFEGVVEGAPKLVQIDPRTDSVVEVFRFDSTVAPGNSYLNDVRIDTAARVAYITDSEAAALVVVDLSTGASRRVLDDHSSTKAEDISLTIDGEPWDRVVHADAIALSPDRSMLYYKALTGRTLYRVPTAALRDDSLDEAALGARVERVADVGPTDGIAFGADGSLYLTAIDQNAIRRMTPDGNVELVVADPRLSWPDSLAIAADGAVLVTTAQIHLDDSVEEPFRVIRFEP
ncbi:MAG: L-dopachrome tautomerase-related protein [Planctomycetota bacterium]